MNILIHKGFKIFNSFNEYIHSCDHCSLINRVLILDCPFRSSEAMPGLDMGEFHADSCTVNRLYSIWMVSSASVAVVPNVDM